MKQIVEIIVDAIVTIICMFKSKKGTKNKKSRSSECKDSLRREYESNENTQDYEDD